MSGYSSPGSQTSSRRLARPMTRTPVTPSASTVRWAASTWSGPPSMTTSEGASTVAGESTDPGDENVVYDTYSPEELSSIEQSEADEEAKEEAEEDAKEETGAHESAKADDGPTGKVTKIKKNKAGNYVKPESTSKAVEPPLSATMPEESESAH